MLKDPLTASEAGEESTLSNEGQRLLNDSFEADEGSGLGICGKFRCDEASMWAVTDCVLLDNALEDKSKQFPNESFMVDEESGLGTHVKIQCDVAPT